MNELTRVVWGGIKWEQDTMRRISDGRYLEHHGFKVYSQNDEDGIIEEIFHRIGTTNRFFVEFGIQNGLESNGHYLLLKGWHGLWMEGDSEYCNDVKKRFAPIIAKGALKIEQAFITKDNINKLISDQLADNIGDPDLLIIDIDGNDYHVWESLECIKPRVVCIEYNGKFPPEYNWKQAYNEYHRWDGSDWHGASLKALEELGQRKGYALVGCSIVGVNAFFVRKNQLNEAFIEPYTAEHYYNPLRKSLVFEAGHPARFCLAGQVDELGIFNYYTDRVVHMNDGFGPPELGAFCWMLKQQAQILICTDRLHKTTLQLHYKYTQSPDAPSISATVKSGDEFLSGFKVESEGTIELDVSNMIRDRQVLPIDISVSQLWNAALVNHCEDDRDLGIMVYLET